MVHPANPFRSLVLNLSLYIISHDWFGLVWSVSLISFNKKVYYIMLPIYFDNPFPPPQSNESNSNLQILIISRVSCLFSSFFSLCVCVCVYVCVACTIQGCFCVLLCALVEVVQSNVVVLLEHGFPKGSLLLIQQYNLVQTITPVHTTSEIH